MNVRYRYFMVYRDSNPIQVSIDIVEIRYRTRTNNPHPPPSNANNIQPYTFVTLFSRKAYTPTPTALQNTLMAPNTECILGLLILVLSHI